MRSFFGLFVLLCLITLAAAPVGLCREKKRHWKGGPPMTEIEEEYVEYSDGHPGDDVYEEYDDEDEPDISPKEEKKVFQFLKKTDPGRIRLLEMLRHKEPFEYREAIRDILSEMNEMDHLRKDNPKLFEKFVIRRKLEVQSHRLADEIHRSRDKTRKAKLEEELRAVLQKLFPLRCLELETQINELSEELAKAKKLLEIKRKNKDKVIERRFRELTGVEDALDW